MKQGLENTILKEWPSACNFVDVQDNISVF